jgi:uncharacterized membrane protein YbhN (UPF0104 family)
VEKIELVDDLEDISLKDVKQMEILYLVVTVTCLISLVAFLIWSGSRELAAWLVIPLTAILWGTLHVCRLVVRNWLDAIKFVRREEEAMDLASNTLGFGEDYQQARQAASDRFHQMNDSSDIVNRNFTVRTRLFILSIVLGLLPVGFWYGVGLFIRIALESTLPA